jgi:molybdopterin biosynthesis enzyme
MLGLNCEEPRPVLQAMMPKKIAGVLGRQTYVRVKVVWAGGKLAAIPISAKGSGTITTMTQSNGFVIIPENRGGINQDETVTVHMFANVETEN